MKRCLLVFLCLALMLLGSAGLGLTSPYDRETADEVGYADAISRNNDGVLVAKPCYIYAVTAFYTGGGSSSYGWVELYDNASSASGIVKVEILENTTSPITRFEFARPLKMENGIYADVTNASVVVEWR